jgi:hypothetical protein
MTVAGSFAEEAASDTPLRSRLEGQKPGHDEQKIYKPAFHVNCREVKHVIQSPISFLPFDQVFPSFCG